MDINMEVDSGVIIQEFKLQKVGGKGFYSSRKFECNVCGKSDKRFSIKFIGSGGLVNCFVCGNTDSIFNWLFKIKRTDLILNYHNHDYNKGIKFDGFMKNDNYDSTDTLKVIPEVNLPIGFKRLKTDPYLVKRGITPEQIKRFGVGTVESFINKKLKGYLIFQMFNNQKLVGWIARTKHDKKWHDKNRADHKLDLCNFIPRYRNSPSTEFQEVLGNFDSIKEDDDTVIIVEGITDMFNVENMIPPDAPYRVVFTFGNKISDYQKQLLKSKKNIETVILMYDYDTIKQMKKISLELMEDFNNVFVAQLEEGEDPGNLNKEQVFDRLSIARNPVDYFKNIIEY